MAAKSYEFTLEKFKGEYILRNYKDEDRHFKSQAPVTFQDNKIIKGLTKLVKELYLNKLNVKIEID